MNSNPVTPREASSHRDNNFNLLRLILASLVLLSHGFELQDGNRSREPLTRIFHTLSFGEVAVDGFFLLSGFLIVGSYLKRPEIANFMKHRILRIFPGFLVCVLICVLIVGGIGGDHGYYSAIDLRAFFGNLAILKLEGIPPVFAGTPGDVLNGSLWSLNPEFQCYLIALVCGLLGVLRRRLIWLTLGIAFAVLHVMRETGFTLTFLGTTHNFYRELYRLGMFFVVGGFLQMAGTAIPYRSSVAWMCAVILAFALYSKAFAEPALAVFGGYILMWFAYVDSPLLKKLRRLPDVSYGTYLYGWPIQKLLVFWLGTINPMLLFSLAVPLSWLLGAASWFWVEKPALALRSFRFGGVRKPLDRPSNAAP